MSSRRGRQRRRLRTPECVSRALFLFELSCGADAVRLPLQDRWQPELQKLINNFNKRFSAAMDSECPNLLPSALDHPGLMPAPPSLLGLDNRGEVRIREHEDYAQWAIEIMVSFRAEDKLHLLTATHQSGGVRNSSLVPTLSLPTLTSPECSSPGTITLHHHVPHEHDRALQRTLLFGRRVSPTFRALKHFLC